MAKKEITLKVVVVEASSDYEVDKLTVKAELKKPTCRATKKAK